MVVQLLLWGEQEQGWILVQVGLKTCHVSQCKVKYVPPLVVSSPFQGSGTEGKDLVPGHQY